MNIQIYLIAWNEIETIHLTIKHYQSFGAKIKVFDNYSNDGTPEICRLLGCEVESFGIPGQLNDAHYLKVKNRCWRGSQADWVIVCDADEILTLSEEYLQSSTGNKATIFKTKGYNVYSHDMPKEDYFEITTYHPDDNYSKLVIFDPKAITDMQYQYGCHKATPQGNVKYSDYVLPLFHFRAIGGPDRMVKRHAQYRKRLSDLNKTLKLGSHYNYPDERRIREWAESYDRSVTYSQVSSSQ